MAPESNRKVDVSDGVSDVEEAEGSNISINHEFIFAAKKQNAAVGKRDVNGFRSGSVPPIVNGSVRAPESLLGSSSKFGDESEVLLSSDYNGFMSENGIQALSTNANSNENRTLASIIREENQMVAQRIYNHECESLFSILPEYPSQRTENKSCEVNDSHRERLKHPESTRDDQPVKDLARITIGGHGSSGDLLQEDHELHSKWSASSSSFHHASQCFSDQILNVTAFTGLEPTVGETHDTLPIPNASEAHEYLWRSKPLILQPSSKYTPNLPLGDSKCQLYCNFSSGTTDISDIEVPSYRSWEWQVMINMNESDIVGSIHNFNGPKIINECESDPTVSGIGISGAHPNTIACLSDLYSGKKSSDFPPSEASDSYLDSKIQCVDFLGHADLVHNKYLHTGETLDNEIERNSIQSAEVQMAYLQKNVTATGNVCSLRNDFGFGITSRDFIEFQKAYLEQAMWAQPIRQRECYLSNISNKCLLNPSHGHGLRYRENSMINGSKNHIFHNRRVAQYRNGTWHSDIAAKSGGGLHTPFLDGTKISKVNFFELPDIIGQVVEFSMDQCGSRFIQKKLETASEIDKNLIFPEISLHARELMTDVFGNYVIQKFLECGTTSQRRELVDQLYGFVLILSLDKYGCRVIQKALYVVDVNQTLKIIKELSGAVIKCVHDHNGNHVIQKCIESIPGNLIQPIITTFYGHVAALSTHPYGCHVIQRVLEYCVDQKTREIVFNEILESVTMLAQNQYGNYVVQRLLLHGKPHEQSVIIRKLVGQVVNMSRQKYASNVIEMCLEHCTQKDRQLLVNEILRPTGEVEPLQVMMQDQYGNYVVQKILKTCTDKDLEPILSRIKVHLKSLKKYTNGKNIVSRIEKLVVTEGSYTLMI